MPKTWLVWNFYKTCWEKNFKRYYFCKKREKQEKLEKILQIKKIKFYQNLINQFLFIFILFSLWNTYIKLNSNYKLDNKQNNNHKLNNKLNSNNKPKK